MEEDHWIEEPVNSWIFWYQQAGDLGYRYKQTGFVRKILLEAIKSIENFLDAGSISAATLRSDVVYPIDEATAWTSSRTEVVFVDK